VRVAKKLIVHAGGRVVAEVHARSWLVDEGGVIEGPVHVVDDGASACRCLTAVRRRLA